MIPAYQQNIVDNVALKANQRWREHGERPGGYLKRTAATQLAQRSIMSLVHPLTRTIYISFSDLQDAAVTFYVQRSLFA
ncbi:hypothetical protein BX666DRAFT_1858391 [Dichotomocladium elegans]|nr:hypothetical protein BX666DRAFT_1858391 [Dichotomocladium elegans]